MVILWKSNSSLHLGIRVFSIYATKMGLGLRTVACIIKDTHLLKASELETVIEECLRLMRLRAQIPPDQELKIRRFHTDATKSVKAGVEK